MLWIIWKFRSEKSNFKLHKLNYTVNEKTPCITMRSPFKELLFDYWTYRAWGRLNHDQPLNRRPRSTAELTPEFLFNFQTAKLVLYEFSPSAAFQILLLCICDTIIVFCIHYTPRHSIYFCISTKPRIRNNNSTSKSFVLPVNFS